jgi:hypothetical protein
MGWFRPEVRIGPLADRDWESWIKDAWSKEEYYRTKKDIESGRVIPADEVDFCLRLSDAIDQAVEGGRMRPETAAHAREQLHQFWPEERDPVLHGGDEGFDTQKSG